MFSVIQSPTSFSSGNRDIRVDCFVPNAGGRRLPAVLALYGFGGSHVTMTDPARELAAQGFAVYVLHYFDRTGMVEAEKAALVRHFPAWMKTIWDAVSFVECQAETDPSRIALIGFSLGGYLAVCISAIDPRIKAVVEFFGGLPKEMKLFMRRLCPTLILHGEDDAIVPVSEAYYLRDALEKRSVAYEIKVYPGVGHSFSGEAWRDAQSRALAFLRKYLSDGDGPSQGTFQPATRISG
ncbi:MAG TPA: dienelactone hydrolase family protein [Terriglobales bacterium]|jgi:carboxymethylenebutenolidase